MSVDSLLSAFNKNLKKRFLNCFKMLLCAQTMKNIYVQMFEHNMCLFIDYILILEMDSSSSKDLFSMILQKVN